MDNIFKQLRKSKGLTQKELANLLFLDQTTISKWELGKAIPDYLTLNKLAEFYDVSTDYLLGRTDSPAPPYPSGGIEDVRTELKRLGIDGNDEELHYLLKKIGSLTPEQKQLIITMIENFKE